MNLRFFFNKSVFRVVVLLGLPFFALAQSGSSSNALIPLPLTAEKPASRSVSAWLLRMHEASRRRAYVGTFVVSSSQTLATSKIWHVCDGEQQIERIERLTGAPQTTFRHNDQVLTLVPERKVIVSERRESLGLFPGLLKSGDNELNQFYSAQSGEADRVAGFDADVVFISPKDKLRFGYRIWSEKKTGLVVKLQTLDLDGRVLEQSAFSDLQIDVSLNMNKMAQMMAQTDGYRVDKIERTKANAIDEGWVIKNLAPGFHATNCFRRLAQIGASGAPAKGANNLQCIYSDGLASISLFIEPISKQTSLQEGAAAMGATHMLTKRLQDSGLDWSVTLVGEVPTASLAFFIQGLERKK